MNVPKNFGTVVPAKLFRSSQPNALHIPFLHTKGINTIVSLREQDTDDLSDPSLKLVSIPCSVIPGPTEAQVVEFLRVATGPGIILVHCEMGEDRTGLMCAAYRRAVQGWTVEKTLDELNSYHFHRVLFNIREAIEHMNIDRIKTALAAPAPAKFDPVIIAQTKPKPTLMAPDTAPLPLAPAPPPEAQS